MKEVFDQLRDYANGVWRYRWYMLAVSWCLSLAGWMFVHTMPDEYQASARVQVDTDSLLKPLMRGLAVERNVDDQLIQLSRTLLNRPNLEKVARMTDMDLSAKSARDMEQLITGLKNKIFLSPQTTNIYYISYVNNDPQLAKRVVEALLNIFVESGLGNARQDTDSAQTFLDQLIQEYELRLIEAEDRMKDFKRKNLGVMPGTGKGYFANLNTAKGELEQARIQLKEARNRRDALKRQLSGDESIFVQTDLAGSRGLYHPLDEEIAAHQRQLDALMLKYTVQHPNVILLQETISELESQREADQQNHLSFASEDDAPLEANPIYQQLKVSLGEAEAEVASLSARVDEFGKRVANLEELLDTVPQVEVEFVRLNRDYDIYKSQYALLLQRREQAALSEEVGNKAENVKFKIIDPPFAPSKPSGPNRPLYISAVLIAALAAGIGVAFSLSQIRPVFDSRRALTSITNLPVFGCVAEVVNPQRLIMRRLGLFSFLSLVVSQLALYAVLVAFQLSGAVVGQSVSVF